MHVPYVNLALSNAALKEGLLAALAGVIDSGQFVLGQELKDFEHEFAALCGTKYAVSVDNGTSALILAMRGLGIGEGDEVITVPNSFLASASSVALIGATPVFVDVGPDFLMDPSLLEAAITPKTKAIIPVHLTGRSADMDAIMAIADRHGIPVLEDCAQAVGATYKGKHVGGIGRAGTFSFHPLKNLSALGDAGMIITNDDALHEYLLVARTHGLKNRDECVMWSPNRRMHTLQAACLRVKMNHLPEWTEARRKNAAYYREHLADVVTVPSDADGAVYHTFIIQTPKRQELKEYLKEKGVETAVHYPIPIHLQAAASSLGYKKGDFPVAEKQADTILSLPVYPELTAEQREYVVRCIREFFGQ